ncbi:MAG: alpha/beta hydrolase [Actinobacteria bacterium]|nr:MAG: alpha/beta hydrolase [Actinomycetota bacterium]
MAPVPETRYTNADGVSVAYSVVGDGPPDLVFVPDWLTNLELLWDSPMSARYHERLASFSRLIVFDKRGTGLSDPVALTELPTLEQWMDDVRAVSDAAGSERPALMGVGGAGAMCMLYAATYPERVSALVLVQEFLTGVREQAVPERVLLTVLFTDIGDSTRRAVELGDRAWRNTLERHHTVVRQQLERFRGREVDTAGDGFFATFDGPARGIRCARAIVDVVQRLGIGVRNGLHTGECELIGDKIVEHITSKVCPRSGGSSA